MSHVYSRTILAASLLLSGLNNLPSFAQEPTSTDKEAMSVKCGNYPGTTQFQRAWVYDQGLGVPINIPEAVRLYKEAVDLGNPLAKGRLARIYFSGNGVLVDNTEADLLVKGIAKEVTKSAESNIAVAQIILASMYIDGLGVPRDQAEGLKWLRKAADQNLSLAQSNLGVVYENGVGVERDYSEAVKWYRKAAEQNLAIAQGYLGDMYYFGKGVDKDNLEAVKWYRKSADQNFAHAENNLGRMYNEGCGVIQDQCEAAKWFRKSAEQNFVIAQANLGMMYANGTGVVQDLREAEKWYRKAAAQGDEDSRRELRRLGFAP